MAVVLEFFSFWKVLWRMFSGLYFITTHVHVWGTGDFIKSGVMLRCDILTQTEELVHYDWMIMMMMIILIIMMIMMMLMAMIVMMIIK